MSVWAATKAVLKGVGKVLDYVIKDEDGLAGIDRAKLAKSGNVTPYKPTSKTYAYQYRGPKNSYGSWHTSLMQLLMGLPLLLTCKT